MDDYRRHHKQKVHICHDASSEHVLFNAISQADHEVINARKLTIKPFVNVKSPMGEVLECVHQYHCGNVLAKRHQDPVENFCEYQFPRRERHGCHGGLSVDDLRGIADTTAPGVLYQCCGRGRPIAYTLIYDPSEFKSNAPHPSDGQGFAVTDLLCPHCDGILVWDKLRGGIGHEVSQDALGRLLEQREFNNILFGSAIFRELLSGSVKFVR